MPDSSVTDLFRDPDGTTGGNPQRTPTAVAPSSLHGRGYGSYGGYTYVPPVYLPEDEAAQVIRAELKVTGLTFKGGGRTLKSFYMPGMNLVDGSVAAQKGTLTVDGSAQQGRLCFLYVSRADIDLWATKKPAEDEARLENTAGAAALLRSALEGGKPGGTFAVFYDPLTYPSEVPADWKPADKDDAAVMKSPAWAYAREQLRLQVRDFVTWYQAQQTKKLPTP
jgi:hypothetical protein